MTNIVAAIIIALAIGGHAVYTHTDTPVGVDIVNDGYAGGPYEMPEP